jgi:hypothetical protein
LICQEFEPEDCGKPTEEELFSVVGVSSIRLGAPFIL